MMFVWLWISVLPGSPCQPPPGRPPLAHVAGLPGKQLVLAAGGGTLRVVLPASFRPQTVEFSLTAADGRDEISLPRAKGRADTYHYPKLPHASKWSLTEDVTDFLDRPPDCRRRVHTPIAAAVVR